jgi:hypothetical protein
VHHALAVQIVDGAGDAREARLGPSMRSITM